MSIPSRASKPSLPQTSKRLPSSGSMALKNPSSPCPKKLGFLGTRKPSFNASKILPCLCFALPATTPDSKSPKIHHLKPPAPMSVLPPTISDSITPNIHHLQPLAPMAALPPTTSHTPTTSLPSYHFGLQCLLLTLTFSVS